MLPCIAVDATRLQNTTYCAHQCFFNEYVGDGGICVKSHRLKESATRCGLAEPYLREDEPLLVGEDEAAPLDHVVVDPRGVLKAGQVQHVDGVLALHQDVVEEIVVRHHAVLDGVQVLAGAFEVPLFEVSVERESDEGRKIGQRAIRTSDHLIFGVAKRNFLSVYAKS